MNNPTRQQIYAPVVKIDPVQEAIAKRLFGVESYPSDSGDRIHQALRSAARSGLQSALSERGVSPGAWSQEVDEIVVVLHQYPAPSTTCTERRRMIARAAARCIEIAAAAADNETIKVREGGR